MRTTLQSQATYSELLESLRVAELESLSVLEGSLTRREIRGRAYWYVRRRVGDRIAEHYMGPETDELLQRLDQVRADVADAKQAAQNRRALIRMLRADGYLTTDRRNGKILEELAAAGVFRLEGCLVGTHAFRCYGAVLGVRFGKQLAITNDVDLAHAASLVLGVTGTAEPALGEALARAERFVRVPELDPRHPSTSWRTTVEIRVDVLTPLVGRGKEGPVELKTLGSHATALRFLDFLVHETIPAVVLTGSGVLVRVPTPERFALHKLIVSQRRDRSERLKATKDIGQARVLLEVLLEDEPGNVADAWADLASRGKRWVQAARAGAEQLPGELVERLSSVIA